MGEDMTTTQQFWLILFLGVIPFALIYYWVYRFLMKRFGKKHKSISIDEVGRAHLRARGPIDPAKFYVVLIDTDMGIFGAYLEMRLSPEMHECDGLETAEVLAKRNSYDPEGEVYGYVFDGGLVCKYIFNEGKTVYPAKEKAEVMK